ncbi:Uncharacterised protein [Mycobacterium tuberculosis]|nr:Uncharacterised protein [Mycobacterium tuberculosis]
MDLRAVLPQHILQRLLELLVGARGDHKLVEHRIRGAGRDVPQNRQRRRKRRPIGRYFGDLLGERFQLTAQHLVCRGRHEITHRFEVPEQGAYRHPSPLGDHGSRCPRVADLDDRVDAGLQKPCNGFFAALLLGPGHVRQNGSERRRAHPPAGSDPTSRSARSRRGTDLRTGLRGIPRCRPRPSQPRSHRCG